LQGCEFGQGRLKNTSKGGPEFISLPTCYLSFIPEDQRDPFPEDQVAVLPLYPSGSREKILTKLKVLNEGTASSRIIGGVAICLTDEE